MLKFAVIGIGRMGKRHAMNLYRHRVSGVRLTAVCDIDEDARNWAKKLKNVKVYSDYKEMIESEQLDGVWIATPHYVHPEIAIFAIERGVHTLIEKPLAVTALDAKKIIESANAKPQVKVGVSFNQRSNRMYRYAKNLIDSGKLGDIQRVNFTVTHWYRSQAYYNQGGWRASYSGEGGGCLINQCVHQLDILSYLLGMPKSVVAYTATKDRNITVENDVSAIFRYSGFDCLFSASTHELCGTNRLEIACDRGKIVIGKFFMKVYRHKSQRKVNATTKFGYGFSPSFLTRRTYGFFRGFLDLIFGQQLRAIKAFAREILGKGKQLAEIESGLNGIELINAIYLSGWDNAVVTLPIDDKKYIEKLNEKIEDEKRQNQSREKY